MGETANRMPEALLKELHDRIHAMTEQELEALDPIANALNDYHRVRPNPKGWRMAPNRVVALAAAELVTPWEQTIWERD
jgi:hypothetical protein